MPSTPDPLPKGIWTLPKPCPPGRLPREGETIFCKHITSRSRPDYKIDHSTGCWIWQKGLDHAGYGNSSRGKAHRVYFKIANPQVEITGLDVHHVCHNPPCVNPEHLKVLPHGKHLRDHKRDASTLTEADVLAIRLSPKSSAELGEIYGIPAGTVENLWTRNWAGVPMVKPVRYCPLCGERVPDSRSRRAVYCCVEHRTEHGRLRKEGSMRIAARTA